MGPLKKFLSNVRSRQGGRAPAADDAAQAPIMPLAFYLWSGWALLITTAGARYVSYASLVSALTSSLTLIELFASNHPVSLQLQIADAMFIHLDSTLVKIFNFLIRSTAAERASTNYFYSYNLD